MTNGTQTRWQNRIVGEGMEDADQLLANPANWRIHPKAQQTALKSSLDSVGWVQRVIVNRTTGHVVDGHLRAALAISAGEQVPVLYVDLSEDEERLVLATLDPLAAMAAADREMLSDLLAGLRENEIVQDDAGLKALLGSIAGEHGIALDDPTPDPGAQVDRAAELREAWGTERGQVWDVPSASGPGKAHRIMCGDSTSAEDVARLMGGEKAQMTFTSPPYNAGVSAQLSGNTSIGDNLYRDAYGDNKSQPEYLELLKSFTQIALPHSDYVFVNIQVLAGNKLAFIEYWYQFRDVFADVAVWDKQHAAPQQAPRVMDSRFEFVLVFSHGGSRAIGTREFRGMVHNVYSGSPQRHNDYASSHAATFPTEFPAHFINTFSNRGDIVYEPFAGTGTTAVAAEQTGRVCYGMEIDPGYVAVALERLSGMGLDPVLTVNEDQQA